MAEHPEDRRQARSDDERGKRLALALSMGIALGAVVGVVLDDTAIGIAVGMAMGIAVFAVWSGLGGAKA